MLIRSADAERDAAACAAIYEPFVRDSAISFEAEPPDEREVSRRIERISRTHPWLVAEDDEGVIGYAYGCPHRERAAYRWAADVSAYVHRAHQRTGVGRALYRQLLTRLQDQHLCIACAGITLPNQASVGFHESFGFEPVGVYRQIGFKLGRWWDVGWWQLQLRAADGGRPAEPSAPAELG